MRKYKIQPLGVLAIAAIGFLLIAPATWAQNHVIAIGQVNGGVGTIVASANTLGAGATVTSASNGTGDYTITVTAPGAFSGDVADDFLVELTVESQSSNDEVAKANVSSVNANQLEVDVNTDDVEDSSNLSTGEARNASFFFTIYRVPASFDGPGTTKFLQAAGLVNLNGSLLSGVGVNGIEVDSAQNGGNGDYNVTLTKTGAFAGAVADDFVIILTVRASGSEARGVRGDVSNVADDVVTIRVRVDNLQEIADADDDNPVPIDDQFYFTIYRIPPGAGAGLADSKLLVAMGSVDGNDAGFGPLISGGAFDGAAITKERVGEGDYDLTITSAGAFAGKSVTDFSLQLCLNQSGINDDAITGFLSNPDDDTMIISVYINDVEQAADPDGTPEDRDFFFFLYCAQANPQPDLRIGTKGNLTQHKGDDKYNATGAGQKIGVGLPGTGKKKYFLSLENDGNISDDIFLKAKRSGNKIKSKYFRLTGGRKNVTAAITGVGHIVDGVAPCKIIKFEVQAKYTKPGKRPKKTLRFLARSEFLATQLDANKATLKPK